MSTLDFVRQLRAKQSFKINDKFEFIEFEDVTGEDITDEDTIPDQVEIFAAVKISYNGKVPESYKALNLLIGDWVEEHSDKLSEVLKAKVEKHFKEFYPNSEASDLSEDEDTIVWLDQLDYMPRMDPDDNFMTIEIELVLDAEPLED